MKRSAVFIDKDGTLVRDIPYNVRPELVELQPGARQALKSFRKAGYFLIGVSNQSGIARGFFEESAIDAIVHRLNHLLEDAALDRFYFCPHHPDGVVESYAISCECRKPMPGMLFRAAEEFDLDLSSCWMIGDILHDVEAGKSAGCKTILLDNGNETEWIMSEKRQPDFIVKQWSDSVAVVFNQLFKYECQE
jgi:D-glycero-D-manno-heptose 1,7-bisphosphate phosphatase